MVKHIVMFKLKERNQENIDSLVNALKGMDGKIDILKHLEVGVDFKNSERSFDVVLTTHFDDRAGLEIYAGHAVHQPVIELARAVSSQIYAVDYEV